MKNKSAKKAIVSYYLLSVSLILPLIIPFLLIKKPILLILYALLFFVYMRLAVNFAVRKTVMASILKELDAEKYAAIINAKPFFLHYSYKLNLYFVTGDYQSAYNMISSVLIQHKNVYQRIYGRLLLCRICFERGDYEGLKEHLDEIDNYFKYNTNLKLSKHNKEAYDYYRAFSNADYASVLTLLEAKSKRYSNKKDKVYFLLISQYQLAVTKRMMGNVDEAVAIFEDIKEKAPRLIYSTLAQKQLDYISGTVEEAAPERLANTENYNLQANRKSKAVVLIAYCVGIFLIIAGVIFIKLDFPKQENKNSEYIALIESTLDDDYEKCEILGYLSVYADGNYTEVMDTVFLVEDDGCVDMHTLYNLDGKHENHLNVKDVQVDKLYEYENVFSKKIGFVLTEKKRDIPENALYHYEIDGYYFCVMSITDI